MTWQRLFEQREVLQKLTENAMRVYRNVAVLPVLRFGSVAASETVAPTLENAAFPIPGYSMLTSAQIADKLTDLPVEELKRIRAFEMEHKGRKALLSSIEHRLRTAG